MRTAPLLLLVSALVACSPPPDGVATDADSAAHSADDLPSTVPPVPATPAFDSDCAFCANPATVRSCDVAAGVATTLYWDVVESGVATVGLFVVDESGQDTAFAEQPAKGSIATGPWLRPGLTFKLKDPDGNLLHELVIEGVEC